MKVRLSNNEENRASMGCLGSLNDGPHGRNELRLFNLLTKVTLWELPNIPGYCQRYWLLSTN